MLSKKQSQASLPDKMLGLIRPLSKQADTKSQGQGLYLPDRDQIPYLPIALTQCHFMQWFEIFGFLHK